MLSGEQNNTVYLSKLLNTDPKYSVNCKTLIGELENHHIPYHFLEATKQIWCRDYMPIQVSKEKFVQFRYEPSYCRPSPEYYTDSDLVCKVNGIKTISSTIKLDGGNVVSWSDKVILSDRVVDENPEFPSKTKLLAELEKYFETEVIIIPQIELDYIGHADSMVRFVDSKTLIGNDRKMKGKAWKTKMDKVLRKHGLNYIDVPFFHHKNKIYPDNAIGCYVNFLEVQHLIIIPVFEIENNRDDEALEVFSQAFPHKELLPINFNQVGFSGGLLNCATWTLQEDK
ncbi:MAG: agmatine deiminase family protein [Cyclobacteriaceae bacterium]